MRQLRRLGVCLWLGAMGVGASQPALLGRLPIVFEPNRGQAPPEVRFLSRGQGHAVFLDSAGFSVVLPSTGESIRFRLEGARHGLGMEGEEPTGGVSNYYRGEKPSDWIVGAPHYTKVRYRNALPGIDLVFYGNPSTLEFDLILSPGADPSALHFQVEGAKSLAPGAGGNLLLRTRSGKISLGAPVVYQNSGGGHRRIASQYRVEGAGRFGFSLGDFEPSQPLVIDPTLITSYLGGRDVDIVTGIRADSSGNFYLTGITSSTDFTASSGVLKTALTPGDTDAFVVKLNSTATSIVYSTFLGGTFGDIGRAIAVDSSGAAYVTGQTLGRFPVTTGAYRETPADAPAPFVAKLAATGGSLTYATYLDGAGAGLGIAVDSGGNAYVAGQTYTATFTTTVGAFQRTYSGNTDAFVVKLNPTGTGAVYSTFLGGRNEDQATAIVVDSTGAAYVTGFTASTDYPVTGGTTLRQTNGGGTDAFVTKLNSAGTALSYSTYLGGSNTDRGYGIDVDSAGNAYVVGQTLSADFQITLGAFRTVPAGGSDAFVTKLNPTATAAGYSTYLGGTDTCFVQHTYQLHTCDTAFGVRVDDSGQAWVTGVAGTGFPVTASAHQSTPAGQADAFVTQLNAAGNGLLYSSFVGGTKGDAALAIALATNGPVVAGVTQSTNFPVTTGQIQTTNRGGTEEGFFTRVASCAVTLASSGSFFPAASGDYSLSVFAASDCAWSVTTQTSWVTLNTTSGRGNGAVPFNVAQNNGPARTGTFSVSGQVFTLQQVSGACVTLASTGSWHPQNAGNYALQVYATCPWTAVASDPTWITLVGASGSGNSFIGYGLTANPSASARFGTITVNGQVFEVRQVGGPAAISCVFSLSSSTDTFNRAGGSSSVLVQTEEGCPWTAASPVDWIILTGGEVGDGTGVVGYTITENKTGQLRFADVSIAGGMLRIFQNP